MQVLLRHVPLSYDFVGVWPSTDAGYERGVAMFTPGQVRFWLSNGNKLWIKIIKGTVAPYNWRGKWRKGENVQKDKEENIKHRGFPGRYRTYRP